MDHNVRGNVQKNKSKFKDIIQIKVDHLPSYPIFDKSFFDKFYLLHFSQKCSREKKHFIIFMHEISHNMKNVHKINENIGRKAIISLKFIKNK